MRRTEANIERDIQGFTLHHTAELCLCMMQLVMQSSQGAFAGAGVIILHEGVLDAERRESIPVISLHKKSPRIADYFRAKLEDTRNTCFHSLHEVNVLAVADRATERPGRYQWEILLPDSAMA